MIAILPFDFGPTVTYQGSWSCNSNMILVSFLYSSTCILYYMYFLQITSCVSCHSSCIMQCILVLWGALKILLSFLVFTPWICLANFSSPRRRFFFFLWEAELFFLLSLCLFHNTKRSRLRSRSFHQLYSVVRHAKRLQLLLELLFFRVIVILQQNNRSREWRVR